MMNVYSAGVINAVARHPKETIDAIISPVVSYFNYIRFI